MPLRRVLVVDDDAEVLEAYGDILGELPELDLRLEADPRAARDRLTAEAFDLVVTDLSMPEVTGIDLLRHAREHGLEVPVLIVTAYPSIENAVESLRFGATDYLVKPFPPEKLLAAAARILDARARLQEVRLLYRQLDRSRFDDLLGHSPVMERVFEAIERVAATPADVLIVGKPGTGKSMVAACLHRRSGRVQGRFVPVGCGTIPESEIEAELLGYEGSLGDRGRSQGLVGLAHQGTLYLDEVTEMPPGMQVKLVQVLQARQVRPVGGTQEQPVDIRVVASTSRDPREEVAAGRLREDLFYRISVVRIDVPPLSERGEDVLLLARHFVETFAGEYRKRIESLARPVEAVFKRYSWPGNVWELQNACRRAVTMAQGPSLSVADLPEEILAECGTGTGTEDEGKGYYALRKRQLDDFERSYFHDLLRGSRGDIENCCRRSGVSRATLYRILKRFGLDPDAFRN